MTKVIIRAIQDADISRVVGAYLRIIPNGDRFKCSCPFHSDQKKSLIIFPQQQHAYCAVCNKTWDALSFISDIECISENEAIGVLMSSSWEDAALTRRDRIWPHLCAYVQSPPPDSKIPTLSCRALGGDFFSFLELTHDSTVIAYRVQYAPSPGSTEWRWWFYKENPHGRSKWDMWTPSREGMPLYGANRLGEEHQAIGLAFTPESAEALSRMMPVYAPVSLVGTDSLAHDWSALKGRERVLIWPPASDALMLAAVQIASVLSSPSGLALSVKVIDPDDKPEGWGPADAEREGWKSQDVREWAAPRLKEFTPENWRPVAAPKKQFLPSGKLTAFTPEAVAAAWIKEYGEYWRYVANHESWMRYTEIRWRPLGRGPRSTPSGSIRQIIISALDSSSGISLSNENREKLLGQAFVSSVVRILENTPKLRVTSSEINFDRACLCTPNGIIDLRTSKIALHSPDALITLCTSVSPSEGIPNAWLAYLSQQPIANTLQRLAGYLLTGLISERKFFWLQSDTIFLRVMSEIMGDYAMTVTRDALTDEKLRGKLSAMRHKRVVHIEHTYSLRTKHAFQIGAIAEGGLITVGMPWGVQERFIPQARLCFSSLYSPVQNPSRRLSNAMFHIQTSTPSETDLIDRLRDEYPQILAWAIQGAAMWFESGLCEGIGVKRPG
jgi:putative DNA primase/helicase